MALFLLQFVLGKNRLQEETQLTFKVTNHSLFCFTCCFGVDLTEIDYTSIIYKCEKNSFTGTDIFTDITQNKVEYRSCLCGELSISKILCT